MSNENEIAVVNSTQLVSNISNNDLIARANAFKTFKDFLRNDLIDGMDFGMIPGVNKPSLFKAGGEKIQMYLGLSPVYRLLNREFIQSVEHKDKVYNESTRKYEVVEAIRNYYAWEWSCELWYGNTKVAEGVGCANSEEDKWVSQYKGKKTPDSLANTIMKMSKKRAFMDAIIGVSGVSDMFTQDLEDSEDFVKLKVDKKTKASKLTKENIKTIYATLGALSLVQADLDTILGEFGHKTIQECESTDCNKIIEKIKEYAKSKRG